MKARTPQEPPSRSVNELAELLLGKRRRWAAIPPDLATSTLLGTDPLGSSQPRQEVPMLVPVMPPQPKRPVLDLVCTCGITFEPLPWYDPDLDQPICDGCAGGRDGR